MVVNQRQRIDILIPNGREQLTNHYRQFIQRFYGLVLESASYT